MTTIGFTRPNRRLKDSINEAKELGFTVMAAPSLNIIPGNDSEFRRLEQIASPGAQIVFGSVTAVEECKRYFKERLVEIFKGCYIISIGPKTTKCLEGSGLAVDSMPIDFSSYGLLDIMKDKVYGNNVILIRSDCGTSILPDGLRNAGACVHDIASYKLTQVHMSSALLHMMLSIKKGDVDVMLFTSPMSVSSFISSMEAYFGKPRGHDLMKNMKIAAIGRPTAMKLVSVNLSPDFISKKATFHDMLLDVKNNT